MEEDINILDEVVGRSKELREKDFGMLIGTKQMQSIENLIKGYRELEYKYDKALTDLSIEAKRTNEENYRCSLFAVENNDLKEKLADSISKSKIKEKIEEYQANMKKYEYADKNIFNENNIRQEVITVLQELMEDK